MGFKRYLLDKVAKKNPEGLMEAIQKKEEEAFVAYDKGDHDKAQMKMEHTNEMYHALDRAERMKKLEDERQARYEAKLVEREKRHIKEFSERHLSVSGGLKKHENLTTGAATPRKPSGFKWSPRTLAEFKRKNPGNG